MSLNKLDVKYASYLLICFFNEENKETEKVDEDKVSIITRIFRPQ